MPASGDVWVADPADPTGGVTPMMRQYRDLKQRYPDYLLLFRLGDFYELFLEDAELGARLLQITLTSRQGWPMAGIPHHAAEVYIARLIRAGQKVALCEQLEAPGKGKKLLKRDVVRLITPGTITDTAFLAGSANNFLLAVVRAREGTGVALLDVSTGDFWAGEDAGDAENVLAAALMRRPSEILVPETAREAGHLMARLQATGATLTFWDPAAFALRRAVGDLCAHFGATSLAPFGVSDMTVGLQAAGAALAYVRATQGEALGHLTRLARLANDEAMTLDPTAVQTLELIDTRDGDPRMTLFGVLDETATPMGARLLRQWLLRPLLDLGAIAARQAAVQALIEDSRQAREWIAGLEERERSRTGLSSLRVRFNRVFGYGIEVSHAQATRVPAEYVRRQTLTGAERYVTPELKEYETKVLGAEERRRRLEYELFEDVRRRVAAEAGPLLTTARALARLDVLLCLADGAHFRGHVRPVVDAGDRIEIVDGRHPVLEARSTEPVTPNDLALDAEARVVILTGPNMSGKSVYLRQTGHLVILAQMGAFVPAREARLGLVDRLFTRVGAQDNLGRGQSTFLVEMVETATILNNVTARSLVLLDEVGRGTSTFDGLAIAWSVVEALHERSGCKVLFATHFHELTELANRLAAVRNFHVAVREWNDQIIFLHKVRPGGTDRSYGIQVARLAGLPDPVIARAKALLSELEAAGERTADARDAEQLGLFAVAPPDPILIELAHLDLAHLTPMEALNLLAKWQAQRGGVRKPEGV